MAFLWLETAVDASSDAVADKRAPGLRWWFKFEYSNRRSHERVVEVDRELFVGDEITLFGHRWRVKDVLPPTGRDGVPKVVWARINVGPAEPKKHRGGGALKDATQMVAIVAPLALADDQTTTTAPAGVTRITDAAAKRRKRGGSSAG